MAEAVYDFQNFGDVIGSEVIQTTNTAGGKALSASVYEQPLRANDDSVGGAMSGPGNIVTKVLPRTAVILVENQPIRVGFAGIKTPAQGANGGFPILAGQTLVIHGHGKIKSFRAIADNGANSGGLQVVYFR